MNIHPQDGIKPVSDFRKDAAGILKGLRERHEPIVLTQRGRSVAVLLDMETYDRLEYASHFRSAYAKGVSDLKKGKSSSQTEVARYVQERIK